MSGQYGRRKKKKYTDIPIIWPGMEQSARWNDRFGNNKIPMNWWQMLETKCVGDNFKMLVTVFTVFVANILNLLILTSSTSIQKMSPISKFCRQNSNIVTNIKSPTSTWHEHLCSRYQNNDQNNPIWTDSSGCGRNLKSGGLIQNPRADTVGTLNYGRIRDPE